MYCALPKVASTNWKRTFLSLDSRYTTKQLRNMTSDKIHWKLTRPNLNDRRERTPKNLGQYYRLLFVRHPFERLVSAYRDKFFRKHSPRESTHYKRVHGRQILRLYRENPSEEQLKSGEGVTFTEFARYLVEKNVSDIHWDPIYDTCHPCLIDYHFIGHMRNLQRDAREALDHIGLKDDSFFRYDMSETIKHGYLSSSRGGVIKDFPSLGRNMIDKLYQKYENDFLAFGFEKYI